MVGLIAARLDSDRNKTRSRCRKLETISPPDLHGEHELLPHGWCVMATSAARKRWSEVIFRNAVEIWWDAWCALWQEIGGDLYRKAPPRSVEEYIDRRYARLDARDEETEHDAHEIDRGFGGDAAGTGGQD